jgi:adenylate cyclase
MDLARLRAAGLYDPDAPTASDRLALLQYLDERGATVEQMVEADAEGLLYALSSYLAAFAPVEWIGLAEVAERSGATPDRVRRLLLAEGIPVDDTTLLPAFVVDDVAASELGMSLFGEEATLAFTRVVGASVSRIVDAAISLFYGEFYGEVDPTVPSGATELERARVNESAGAGFAVLPGVVVHLLEQYFRLNSVRSATTRGDTGGQTVTVGIGFVDLVGSTAWAARLSLRDQALALARFESAAWDIATEHGGRVVKLIGDEAMIVGASAESVGRIAVALCAAATADPGLPPARGGVGYGEVIARGGDYFGPLVNLVARSVKGATAGTVVATVEARDRLDPSWRINDLGATALRGIAEPIRLYAVDRPPTR